MAKIAVKQALLAHFKWTQIKPEELQCHPHELAEEKLQVVINNRVRMTLNLTLNLWDCKTHYGMDDILRDLPGSPDELARPDQMAFVINGIQQQGGMPMALRGGDIMLLRGQP
jgi:hypothetical protein